MFLKHCFSERYGDRGDSNQFVYFQPEQLEEIKDIVEMKVTHRRNIIKREKKFGYKSNSTIGLDLAGAAANVIAPDADDPDDMMM